MGSVKVTEGKDGAAAAWDPHDANKVATAQRTGVTWWDLRSFK